MASEIAHFLQNVLKPKGVAVFVEVSHMCAMMRSVKKSQASMTMQTMLGAFNDDKELRAEFITQVANSCK